MHGPAAKARHKNGSGPLCDVGEVAGPLPQGECQTSRRKGGTPESALEKRCHAEVVVRAVLAAAPREDDPALCA